MPILDKSIVITPTFIISGLNEHPHVVNLSLNISFNDNRQVMKYNALTNLCDDIKQAMKIHS